MRSKKKYVVFIMCIIFSIIGLLLTLNEIYADDWYIEATSDGLFGNNNRSLFTLGANYLITGLIYVLSLTGLRFHWLHLIIIFFDFVATYLVCKVFLMKYNNFGIILSFIYLILVTPILYCNLQFTFPSCYFIMAGFMYLFYSIEFEEKFFSFFLSYLLIIIGFSLRKDALYFSFIFFIFVFLIKLFELVSEKKSSIIIKKYFLPFIIVGIFLFFISISQNILIEKKNPGFTEWNNLRAQVDDYEIPNYDEYADDYKQIGVSKNDYLLLKSMNNIDTDYFDKELYNKILKIKKEKHNIVLNEFIKDLFKNTFNNMFIIFIIIILIISIIYNNKKITISIICFLLIDMFLTAYFMYIGRLIWRVEWPIWLIVFLSTFTVISENDIKEIINISLNHEKKLIIFFSLIILLFAKPLTGTGLWNPFNGANIQQSYIYIVKRENTFVKYLYYKVKHNENFVSQTINREISDSVLQNKDNFYFILVSNNWLQYFPLTDKDILRTSDIGTASNIAFLGQYVVGLAPTKNNLNNYNIQNPFKDLVNKNVYIITRKSEGYSRTKEIYTYLKEHYYEDVSFSIVYDADTAIVGDFLIPFNDNNKDNNISTTCYITASESEYDGFTKLIINDLDYDISQKGNCYLQLIDENNQKKAFYINKDYGYSSHIFYEELSDEHTYSVEIIYEESENNYKIINLKKNFTLK